MRRAVPALAAALLLVAPTVLAFFAGGFFTEPRLIAALCAWVVVLALALVGPAPLARSAPGWLALGGLGLITAWSAISLAWAPLAGAALQNVERLVLYIGVLLVAIGALRSPRARRAVEPVLAAGIVIVIGYGLAGRLLPGIVRLAHSATAGGRLEQPITYWNAEGALAAVGLILCARLAGDRTRAWPARILASAAVVPLGTGVYLSYSRGAIAAAVVGLGILVALDPVRAQLRASVAALGAAVVAAACSAAYPGVASLQGSLGARERQGAIMLAILVALALCASLLSMRWLVLGRRGGTEDRRLPGARRLVAIAAVGVVLVAAGLVIGGLRETHGAGTGAALTGAKATRLTSASSNRYFYWRLGVRAFEHHPFDGLGSGGFRVFWLRERPIRESVQEVHSLELEMATELGLVGLACFLAMIGGIALAARRALRRDRTLAVGWCAAALGWLLHASIDWDWQLPAVSLPAIVLAGALIALAETPARALSAGTSASAALPRDAEPVAPPSTVS